MNASVKVMRSYDYCHFEVSLSEENLTTEGVNDLRKQAALLVDEAVRQYILAKEAERKRSNAEWNVNNALAIAKQIKQIPQEEWTIEQAALMRVHEDQEFWKEYDVHAYMYQDDDPEREHHFSMLRRFQDTCIKAQPLQEA